MTYTSTPVPEAIALMVMISAWIGLCYCLGRLRETFDHKEKS